MEPSLFQGLEEGMFSITPRLAVGRFATAERARRLLGHGVTHILNVADAPRLAEVVDAGFQCVVAVPLEDLTVISSVAAFRCVDVRHEALSVAHSKLLVHCTAGQNRSPTMIWLYFVACGMPPEEAKRLIVTRSPDAIPGNASLVDDKLIEAVRQHGREHGFGVE
jgi:hypothetical protein